MEHVRLLLDTLQYARETIDSRYHIYKSVVHAEILLEIIEYETLNSLTKLKSSEKIKTFFYNLRVAQSNKSGANDTTIDIRPPPGLTDPQGGLLEYDLPPLDHISSRHLNVQEFVKVGPEEAHSLDQLSIFLRNLLDMSTIGEAKIVLEKFKMAHIPNGIDMLYRIFEVFGRTPEHTAIIPYAFSWASGTIEHNWAEYKKVLSAEQFFF